MDKKSMLEALIKHYEGGNKAQFAKRLGMTPQGISTWLSRGTLDQELIFAKCEMISSDWLLTGEGSMLRTDKKPHPDVISSDSGIKAAPSSSEGIPLIPISAMAGAFTGEQTVLEYECERFIVPTFKGAEFLINVRGNSMYPKYNSGDIVACKRVPMKDIFFQWNKVYVLDTGQGPLVKRIKPGSDDNHILIVSDNTDYEPFELHLNSIYNVALVLGVIRLE